MSAVLKMTDEQRITWLIPSEGNKSQGWATNEWGGGNVSFWKNMIWQIVANDLQTWKRHVEATYCTIMMILWWQWCWWGRRRRWRSWWQLWRQRRTSSIDFRSGSTTARHSVGGVLVGWTLASRSTFNVYVHPVLYCWTKLIRLIVSQNIM